MLKKLLTTSVVLVPLLAVAAPKKQEQSSIIRLSLAGGNIVDADGYTKYDPKSLYFLLATGDCDGGSVDLILTPKPSSSGIGSTDDDSKLAASKHTQRVALPRLRNGKGVNIGDNPQQVEKKLNAHPHQVRTRSDLNQVEWVYYANLNLKRKGTNSTVQNYRATYTFRDDKLWAIHYNLHNPRGC